MARTTPFTPKVEGGMIEYKTYKKGHGADAAYMSCYVHIDFPDLVITTQK